MRLIGESGGELSAPATPETGNKAVEEEEEEEDIYFKKLQRTELFSELSIPQDTKIISIILGKYEQCFPNRALSPLYFNAQRKASTCTVCEIVESALVFAHD